MTEDQFTGPPTNVSLGTRVRLEQSKDGNGAEKGTEVEIEGVRVRDGDPSEEL